LLLNRREGARRLTPGGLSHFHPAVTPARYDHHTTTPARATTRTLIVTSAGRRIDIGAQLARLIRQSRGSDFAERPSLDYARDLGRRICLAAGTASLIEVLHTIADDITADHHAHLTTVWSEIIAELEDADDEDNVPTRNALIEGFERSWGTGSWDRCGDAMRAALKTHRNMTPDRVTPDRLQRHGIGRDLAEAFLILVLEPQPVGRPRSGGTKRRREEYPGR
jgi:hypothetical protein